MTDKQTEALKLALEALKMCRALIRINIERLVPIESPNPWFSRDVDHAITAIREALAEQETVLPGGGHVPAVPVAVYGYCPECGGAGVMRERRPNGDDKCTNGHKYPSSKALAEQPNIAKYLEKDNSEQLAQQLKSDYRDWDYQDLQDKDLELVEQPAQQQEPFGYFRPEPFGWTDCAETDDGAIALYERPPASKPWVGLTEEDKQIAFDDTQEGGGFWEFADAIETKLREKNA